MSEYIRDAAETQDLPVTRRLLRHRQNGRHVLLRVSAAPTRNCPFKETLTQGSGCRWHSSELNVLIFFFFHVGPVSTTLRYAGAAAADLGAVGVP